MKRIPAWEHVSRNATITLTHKLSSREIPAEKIRHAIEKAVRQAIIEATPIAIKTKEIPRKHAPKAWHEDTTAIIIQNHIIAAVHLIGCWICRTNKQDDDYTDLVIRRILNSIECLYKEAIHAINNEITCNNLPPSGSWAGAVAAIYTWQILLTTLPIDNYTPPPTKYFLALSPQDAS